MKRSQHAGCVGLVLTAAAALAMAGCQERPGAGRTGTSANTTAPGAAAQTGRPVQMPKRETPKAPAAAPAVPAKTPAAPAKPDAGGEASAAPKTTTVAPKRPAGKLVAIQIDLPTPAFRGTPVPLNEPNVEKPAGKARGPFLAPEGTVNLARGKPVTCSDPAPAGGELDFVTDGDKEASDFGCLELRPGSQWVQIDLGQRAAIYAVICWHSHAEARVYRDVIVQVSDDPDFLDVQTVFNNDYDNSSGQGIGSDRGYVETSEGKLIDAGGVEGRYVRLWSKGNHIDGKNHYTEVEVYGRPAE